MTEPAAPGEPSAVAFLRIGGGNVAGHQLASVLASGARKVIALARGATPSVIALQHAAERQGVPFRIATGAHDLAALVTAQDEMLVLEEGLFTGRDALAAMGSSGHMVLAQPIDQGLSAGFERLDINQASAGAILVPGRLAEKLLELAPDVNVSSALTRIALQSGIPMRLLEDGGVWRLIRSDDDAAAAERDWMRAQFGEHASTGPGRWLARLAAMRLGPDLLHQGKGAGTLLAGAAVVMLLAAGAGWFGYTATGFILTAVAWLLLAAVAPLRSIAVNGAETPPMTDRVADWALDALIVALLMWREPLVGWDEMIERGFAPLVLIGLLRLLAPLSPRKARSWIEERALLCGVLAVACAAGCLPLAAPVLVLALLGSALAMRIGADNGALTMPR